MPCGSGGVNRTVTTRSLGYNPRMRTWTPAILLALATIWATPGSAQQPPATEIVPCGVAGSPLPPCSSPQATPDTVAILDGTVFSVKDLDAKLGLRVEHLDQAVADARRNALRLEIDDALIADEAARLHVAPRDLYLDEVVRKVLPPTPVEVRAEYDAHPDQYGSRPFEQVREFVAGVIADLREANRASEYAGSLRQRFPVAFKADPTAPLLAPGTVLAAVGPRTVTVASAATRLDAAAYAVRFDLWREESEAVAKLVHTTLLGRAAAKRGLSPEAFEHAQVDAILAPPSDGEINAFFQRYRAFFGDTLAPVRPVVVAALQRERRAARERAFDEELRAGHDVRIFVDEPPRPRLTIDTGDSPSRGDPHAPVTVVEYGDFQCPPCGMMYGVVEEALKPYGEHVRYVFRNFPNRFHVFALKAAEAAMAAGAQGRFWQYADVLFRNQRALDVASLKRYAAQLGLDGGRFARDLDSDRFAAAVLEEKRAGARAGVRGTPAYFINGLQLPVSDYSVEGLRAQIEAALPKSAR